jgi:hypothetical protein
MLRRVGTYLKHAVESTLGLKLGDAVNLAIFVLTIISLIAAFVALWDARKSAKQQGDVLAKQVTAMGLVSDSLNKLLDKVVVQTQLANEALKRQIDAESRQPDVRIVLKCSKPKMLRPGRLTYFDSFSFSTDQDDSIEISPEGSYRFVKPRAEVVISKTLATPNSDLLCLITVLNNGTAAMTRATLSLSAIQTDSQDSPDHRSSLLVPTAGDVIVGENMELFRDADVPPLSVSREPREYTFTVRTPDAGASDQYMEFYLGLQCSNCKSVTRFYMVHVTRS